MARGQLEEETAAQCRLPCVDSSSGSVLPNEERFEGREGLSRKTLTRGECFLQKGSHDWLSPLDQHWSALINGLHKKADCTGYIAYMKTPL
jgi:hypothetical protein